MESAACVKSFSETKLTLNNGKKIPVVGFGTFRIRQGDVIMKVVDLALEAGYRLFDTAAVYGNEVYLKQAFQVLLPKYGLEREDIFITTKLAPSDHGGIEGIKTACMKSLENLGLDYVDLYLIHFPGFSKYAANNPKNVILRDKVWQAMVELNKEGKAKSIGVSNYTIRHLEQLKMCNYGVIPAVNQVEWHPYYYQKDLLGFCKENDIVLQAYCSFGGSSTSNFTLLQDPVVKKIAEKYHASCAQILLVWALQRDVAVIPKSTHPDRIKENISLNFRITEADMVQLDALGKYEIKYAWDPKDVA